MLLVRPGGILGVLIALIVAAIFLFVIRPAINDTTDRAFDSADRALDRAERENGDIQSRIDAATNGNYLSEASVSTAVADIRTELGADAELLDFTVSKQGGGNVKYRTGDRAAGFTWGPGREGLEPLKVTLVGSGKLAENVFPISELSAGTTGALTDAVAEKAGADFEILTMTLGLSPATGDVGWTVTGEGDGRSLVFAAKSDGSGLKQVN